MSITVIVEPTNPGQFFACCGLLELADRLWPGAEGWFGGDGFHLLCGGSVTDILQALLGRLPDELTTLENGVAVKPLIAPLRLTLRDDPLTTLTLDSWVTIRVEKGEVVAAPNPPWNFWSGQQTSMRIWTSLRAALLRQWAKLDPAWADDLFTRRVLLTGRFGFDPGAAWTALDVGFSPNEHGLEVASSAAVELLAAVGLQRFRPVVAGDRAAFVYATWGLPLAAPVAAAASTGLVPDLSATRYRGRVVSRGSYAALGYSTPLRGDVDE